jgi:hypothetical protein
MNIRLLLPGLVYRLGSQTEHSVLETESACVLKRTGAAKRGANEQQLGRGCVEQSGHDMSTGITPALS